MAEQAEFIAPAILEQERAYTLRKFAIRAAACLAIGGGIAAGVGEAYGLLTPTDIQLGPHLATAQLTLDQQMIFGLGPLGYVNKPSDAPLGLGFKVNVGEIPSPPSDVSPLSNASETVKRYEELFVDPNHVKESAIHTVTTRAWHDAALAGGFGGAAGLIGFGAYARRKQRKHESAREAIRDVWDSSLAPLQKQRIIRNLLPKKAPRGRIALTCGGLILAAGCNGDHVSVQHADPVAIDHNLDSTPAQGFEIHGELLRIAVDTVAPQIFNFIDDTRKFYNGEIKSFTNSFNDKFRAVPLDHQNTLWIQGVSDNHCNVGIDEFHATVARKFNVNVTLDTGDMTWDGNPAEAECIAAEVDPIVKHNKMAVVMGNHDSPAIMKVAKNHGAIIIQNNILTQVGKFKILGNGDVNESTFGANIHPRSGNLTPDAAASEEGAGVAAAACLLHPDIVMGHEPAEVIPAAEAGCTPEARAGHTHVFRAPVVMNTTTGSYYMNTGTSGGAAPNKLTVGKLSIPATETVCGYTKDTRRLVGCYVITAFPDGHATISDFQPAPVSTVDVSPTGLPALANK